MILAAAIIKQKSTSLRILVLEMEPFKMLESTSSLAYTLYCGDRLTVVCIHAQDICSRVIKVQKV